MSYQEHKQKSPQNINCAVLIISDNRTEDTDESGKLIKQRLSQNGHRIMAYAIVKNEADTIRNKMEELLGQEELQVIITSGGTGVSHRDVTVETVSPLLEKRMDGFGELFRSLSYQEISTGSVMSRAIAGVAEGKIVICIPGSLGAASLAVDKIILPEIGHMVREATR